jgi:hypothetical protein
MSATKPIAVRCCCEPNTIFGYLQGPSKWKRRHILLDKDGHRHEIEIRPIIFPTGQSELAVYSEAPAWLTKAEATFLHSLGAHWAEEHQDDEIAKSCRYRREPNDRS